MNFWSTYMGKLLLTFAMSMVPVIELRGALPFGVANGLGIWTAILVSVVGNLIPAPFIILFIRRIFALLRRLSPRLNALVEKLEARADAKKGTVEKYQFWGLFILVAIPLPGTGAWTGSLVAAMMDMKVKRAFPPIALGVVAAGIIVALITYGVVIFV